MKKTIMILSLMLTLFIGAGCNSDSGNGLDVTETRMTLKIGPKLFNQSSGSSASIIQYYQAVNVVDNKSFRIPVNDLLGFEYQENYSYIIDVICVQSMKDGEPIGNPVYKFESLISKAYEPDEPEDPTPGPITE